MSIFFLLMSNNVLGVCVGVGAVCCCCIAAAAAMLQLLQVWLLLMLLLHLLGPPFCGWAGSCDTTAAAAAMLDFRCVTSILVLATSILVLVAKL